MLPRALRCPQQVDGYAADLRSLRSGLARAAADIRASLLDRMQELQDSWQPTADRLDVA